MFSEMKSTAASIAWLHTIVVGWCKKPLRIVFNIARETRKEMPINMLSRI